MNDMGKLLSAFFVLTLSLQSMALGSSDFDQAEKATNSFIRALNDSSEFNQKLSVELAKGDTKLEVARALLQAIAVVEAAYWGGRAAYGSRLATNSRFWRYWTFVEPEVGRDVLALVGGTASGQAALMVGTTLGSNSNSLKKAVFAKLLPNGPQGLIKSSSPDLNKVDLAIRSSDDRAQFTFANRSQNFKENYMQRRLADLKSLPSVYRKALTELQGQSAELLNEKDPENNSFLGKVISLGGDQLSYGYAVAATMDANVELNKAFVQLAQDLKSELSAARNLQ